MTFKRMPDDLPLLPPSICTLCETCPDRDETFVIDTGATFEPNVLTPLNGRKYVCGHCVGRLITAAVDEPGT